MSHNTMCAEFTLGSNPALPSARPHTRFSFARLLSHTRQWMQTPHVPLNERLLVDIGLSQADIEALGLR